MVKVMEALSVLKIILQKKVLVFSTLCLNPCYKLGKLLKCAFAFCFTICILKLIFPILLS